LTKRNTAEEDIKKAMDRLPKYTEFKDSFQFLYIATSRLRVDLKALETLETHLKNSAPLGSVGLTCRLIAEEICCHMGAKEKNLVDMIKEIKVSAEMKEDLHSIRELGNRTAHHSLSFNEIDVVIILSSTVHLLTKFLDEYQQPSN